MLREDFDEVVYLDEDWHLGFNYETFDTETNYVAYDFNDQTPPTNEDPDQDTNNDDSQGDTNGGDD